MADSARKGGFLALEEAEIPNKFFRKGVDMLVDGHDAEVVRQTLSKDIKWALPAMKRAPGYLKYWAM